MLQLVMFIAGDLWLMCNAVREQFRVFYWNLSLLSIYPLCSSVSISLFSSFSPFHSPSLFLPLPPLLSLHAAGYPLPPSSLSARSACWFSSPTRQRYEAPFSQDKFRTLLLVIRTLRARDLSFRGLSVETVSLTFTAPPPRKKSFPSWRPEEAACILEQTLL